ncbi:MAG: flagellar hook-basal body complex protein FliE [Planctomycetota bacterium]|nr:flagellar hook-basal body complex protein FliE [Planctomycetota bacterium]
MVNKVGGGLAREAIMAAMRSQQDAARNMAGVGNLTGGVGGPSAPGLTPGAPGVAQVGASQPTGFVDALKDGLSEVTQQVRATEGLPEALVKGEIDEFHDVALALKQSDLSFRFALQVRNKLIDAYREVMRMSV